MRLLCITDVHGHRRMFERILINEPEPAALIIGGDLTNFGPPQEAEALIEEALWHCPTIFAVAGNCDSPAIDAMLARRGISLHRHGKELQGFGFFGLSAMPPWRGDMYEFTEEQLDGFLAEGHAQVRNSSRFILVSHPPPCNTKVDRNAGGKQLGSTSVRAWMDKIKPALLVCGHIHEARGVDEVNGTVIVNCGPAKDGYYAVVYIDDEVKVELKQLK